MLDKDLLHVSNEEVFLGDPLHLRLGKGKGHPIVHFEVIRCGALISHYRTQEIVYFLHVVLKHFNRHQAGSSGALVE
mgnify:CR=1 FL=1